MSLLLVCARPSVICNRRHEVIILQAAGIHYAVFGRLTYMMELVQ